MAITRLSRLVAYAVLLVGAILLLCACGRQGGSPGTATEAQLSAGTAVPTGVAVPVPTYETLPGPVPPIAPASESPTHTETAPASDPSDTAGRTVSEGQPSAADLEIRTPGSVQIVPGEMAVYTLSVYNLGSGPATGIVLTDVLPSGVIPVWTQSAQSLCGRQEHDVHCDVGYLQARDAVTVTLDLSVVGTETLITGTQLAGVAVDLSASTCVIDQDSIPPQVTCHVKDLQPGGDAQVRMGVGVDAQMTPLPSQSLVHTVAVAASEEDADPSNNRATFTMTVGAAGPAGVPTGPAAANLVMHADGPSTVIAGQPFTYTYTITNGGALDATRVIFEDALPSDLSLIALAPGRPLCEQQDDTLTCYLDDPGSSETLTFTLVITGHAGQSMMVGLDPLMPGWPICTVVEERTYLHVVHCDLGVLEPDQATHVRLVLMPIGVQERMTANTASVRAYEAESHSWDNTITTTMTVQVRADLSLRSEIPAPALAGETLSYTLTVANLGPSDADAVVLTDVLPAGTRLLSAEPSQGDGCWIEEEDLSAGTITCDLGRLGNSELATVTIVVEVDEALPPAEGFMHSARVGAEQVDPNSSNNELTESIPVSTGDED